MTLKPEPVDCVPAAREIFYGWCTFRIDHGLGDVISFQVAAS